MKQTDEQHEAKKQETQETPMVVADDDQKRVVADDDEGAGLPLLDDVALAMDPHEEGFEECVIKPSQTKKKGLLHKTERNRERISSMGAKDKGKMEVDDDYAFEVVAATIKVDPNWNGLQLLAEVVTMFLRIKYGEECSTSNKKRKSSSSCSSSSLKEGADRRQRSLKMPIRTVGVEEGRDVMPEAVRNRIARLAEGRQLREVVLVMEKKLEETDCKKTQNRLSIPANKLKNKFLKPHEEEQLNDKNKKIENVRFIEPIQLVVDGRDEETVNNMNTTVTLSRWGLFDCLNGKNWHEIVKRNNLSANVAVQLWALRLDDDELWFALLTLRDRSIDELKRNSQNG